MGNETDDVPSSPTPPTTNQRWFASRQPEGNISERRGLKATLPQRRTSVADPMPPAITNVFTQHGINPERVRRRCPAALHYDVTRIQTMLQFLSAKRLDPAKVINKRPQILQMNTKVVASNLVFLQMLPMNVRKVVEMSPELLSLPCHTIQTKIDALAHLGFVPETVLKRFPALISLDLDAIRSRIAFLHHLGLDYKLIVIRSFPAFGLSPATIQSKFTYLIDVGLDAARIIDAQPSVLGRNIDRTLQPIITFSTKDMGRSLEKINQTPACLTYSLEKHIKPRYWYMMAHGRRTDFSLSSLCNLSNQSHRRAPAYAHFHCSEIAEMLSQNFDFG